LGYLPTDNLLAYFTGGFAYGRVEHTGNYAIGNGVVVGDIGGFSHFCAGPATCFAGSSSGVVGGWTLGGGLEYVFWQKWTLKAEYIYISLDTRSVTEAALAVNTPGATPSSFNANFSRINFNVARVGLNYRF
jgi:outer membrane immunogenic protein